MRKFSFVLAMLAIALVFGLAFVSCGGDDGNNNTPGGQTPGGNTPGVGTGNSGWPPSNILSKYGVSGMGQCPGSNFSWNEDYDERTRTSALAIYFTTASNSSSSLDNWFTSNGWTAVGSSAKAWNKDNFRASYNPSADEIQAVLLIWFYS